ncbi:MAG TPA: hypothetical protein VN811_00445 [Thermoanaerobaculia bacterium]|nr:hypothetical protein [Thermoanaerobaculia bacterium]
MKMLTAKVVDGQLDVPVGTLEEGTTVTILVPELEDEEGFDVSEEQKALLLESLEQARRGEGVDGWKLLEELRGRS